MARRESTHEGGSDRAEQIRQAAIRVFSRRGFHGARTEEIAREAGVSEGLLFRYFKTKKDLLIDAVVPFTVESLARHFTGAEDLPEEEVLLRFLRNQANVLRENLDLVKVLFYEGLFHPEVRASFLEQVMSKAVGLLEGYYEGRVRKGRFTEGISPAVAVRGLVSMLWFYILMREVLQEPGYARRTDDEVLPQLVQIFLSGVRAGGGGAAAGEVEPRRGGAGGPPGGNGLFE